jgi:hypothetical protein
VRRTRQNISSVFFFLAEEACKKDGTDSIRILLEVKKPLCEKRLLSSSNYLVVVVFREGAWTVLTCISIFIKSGRGWSSVDEEEETIFKKRKFVI